MLVATVFLYYSLLDTFFEVSEYAPEISAEAADPYRNGGVNPFHAESMR